MKTLKDLARNFGTASREYKSFVDKLPRIMGDVCVKETQKNFIKQGFDNGSGVDMWLKRKPSTDRAYDKRWGVKGSVVKSSNPILMQTKNLYNAIMYMVINKSKIFVGVNLNLVPYAKAHNEGNPSKKLPQRKYLGWTDKMEGEIAKNVSRRINNIFKKFKK